MSKMIVSKRTFFHAVILLVCDLSQAVTSTAKDGSIMISSASGLQEAEGIVEYFKDHEVTEKQARENLIRMRQNDFQAPAYCKTCSREHLRYCHSENLLKDHCCCNQSHIKEQLYFIPHTCFINEDRCYPSLGSCLTVMEIRNCCCDAQLKRHWRSILAGASASRSSKYLSLLLAILVAANSY